MSRSVPAATSLQVLDQNRRRLVLINRLLYGILPLITLAAVADCAGWNVQSGELLAPLPPNLENLHRPLAAVVPLDLPASLFQAVRPLESQKPGQGSREPKIPEVQWKLLGVSIGATKRAFLTDTDGKQSVWVTEGQQLGASRVKEIRERSVVLETGGGTYEIHL
ncbi:MAG: hypothetical protein HY211_05070 [Candidatus Omnitrophica bacterium]|nr:hypothetical protein [Candidatus Omnitrophota bacterium]